MKEVFSSMEGLCVITPGITMKRWLCAGILPQFLTPRNLNSLVRIFGYNRAVARTNSHFGGVEEGTQFAISDLRSHFCLKLA